MSNPRVDPCLTPLCAVGEVPEIGGFQVDLTGREPLAVFRWDQGYYVIDDQCTHGNASLCDGEVVDGEIFCPYHMGAFDLKTGEPTVAPCTIAIRTYRVEVKDNIVYAAITTEF